jgi:hypothetical protein
MANATTDSVGTGTAARSLATALLFRIRNEDAKAALTTMSDNPHVLMGPIAAGGRGRDGVYKFYRDLFLAQIPADIRPVLISQVIGKDILAEEAVYQFTRSNHGLADSGCTAHRQTRRGWSRRHHQI